MSLETSRDQPSAVLKAITRRAFEYWPLRKFTHSITSSAKACDFSGFESERLRGLQIDVEIEFRRLERDIAGLHPAQNLVDQVFTVYAVKNLMK
jgi:hypothetical protein